MSQIVPILLTVVMAYVVIAVIVGNERYFGAKRERARILAEIDRLRPNYQHSTAINAGRRQMLDHLEQFIRGKP